MPDDRTQTSLSNDQSVPRPVTARDLDAWETLAIHEQRYILAGHVNWPMIVKSLIRHIREASAI